MASSPTTLPLRDKEFVDFHRRHDGHINNALNELRTEITALRDSNIQIDVKLDATRDEVLKRIDVATVEISRLSARVHNGLISNPFVPIRPIIGVDANGNTAYPALCPNNAKDFFSLKTGESSKQQETLKYLVQFYDVPLGALKQTDEPVSESDGSDAELYTASAGSSSETSSDTAHTSGQLRVHIVDFLASIFGLDESKITRFRRKAAKRRHAPPQLPSKRPVDGVTRIEACSGSPNRPSKRPVTSTDHRKPLLDTLPIGPSATTCAQPPFLTRQASRSRERKVRGCAAVSMFARTDDVAYAREKTPSDKHSSESKVGWRPPSTNDQDDECLYVGPDGTPTNTNTTRSSFIATGK